MSEEVDPSRYPRLAAYVALLPDGLASYPECKAKGTLFNSALEGHSIDELGEGLPDSLLALMRAPPTSTGWVAATHSDGAFYAIADAFYPRDEDVMEWTRIRTRRTSDSRMYRALSRISSPKTLLKMTTSVHGLFQKGTDLFAEYGPGQAVLTLEHPPHLHGGLNHMSNVPMFEELLAGVRARDIAVALAESTPTHALYRATWR